MMAPNTKIKFDIDIDFADRTTVLEKVQYYTPASIIRDDNLTKHNTGVYFTDVPKDPIMDVCSLDYKDAEERGYVKFDLLNVNVYNQVKSEEHLIDLTFAEPQWEKLADEKFTEQLIHIGNHYNIIKQMMPDTIPRMAMLLSIIRPAKRHLIGKPWKVISETVWEVPIDGSYYFKKSHAVAYAHLVVVHMNLINFTN